MNHGRVTLLDIARATQVSKNTVSLALMNSSRLPVATRRRIQTVARRMGYQKNPTMAHLMSELRRSRTAAFQSSLALINASTLPNAFSDHVTIPIFAIGCRRRAQALGYHFDEFWLHDPYLDGRRLNKIFSARNIRGVVIVGLGSDNRLPVRFREMWERYPCVVTGVRTRRPTLSFASTDHHMVALQAFEQVQRLGYQRIGLAVDRSIERLVEGRYSSGYFIAQQSVPLDRRLRPFYETAEAREDIDVFRRWFKKEKPDVILTLFNVVAEWLKTMGMKVPAEVGLVQLEWREREPEWAGMNQHNDMVGEAAVEMLIGMIHRNEFGAPRFPQATLIGSSWINGKTILTKARRTGH
jgi:LacI family transcriptional regulator